MSHQDWQQARFQLSTDAIHIWVLSLAEFSSQLPEFERVLAKEEVERASRFRFDHLREAYTLTRGALRHILGRYLDHDPAKISLRCTEKGKPELCPPATLHFNLSHSHGLAAIAFATGCPVGIDLERFRPLRDMLEIAARYFCAEEASELLTLPPLQREPAFFACWTRKEAFMKATGDGFDCPLNSFRVNLVPESDARLIHIHGDPVAAEKWSLHDLRIAPGFAAALAYPAARRSLSIFKLRDLHELSSAS